MTYVLQEKIWRLLSEDCAEKIIQSDCLLKNFFIIEN